MNSNTKKKNQTNEISITGKSKSKADKVQEDIKAGSIEDPPEKETDDNLITLEKVHAILLNCINLTRKQKLEYAESERYFMKSYLKKLIKKLKR